LPKDEATTSEEIHEFHKDEEMGDLELAEGFKVGLYLSLVLIRKVPATINARLRPFQRDGVKFLFKLFSQNTGVSLFHTLVSY
jgi:hypothetical protein